MTESDFRLADMMKKEMEPISKVYNPITQQREILVKTDEKTAAFLQSFSRDIRKSNSQQQHHLLPRLHEPFFREKAGININDFSVLLDTRSHQQMTHYIEGYKNAWKEFVSNHPGGSQEQVYHDVLDFATELFETFGFSGSGVERYHRK